MTKLCMILTGGIIFIPAIAWAEEAPVSELAFVLNTFSFLIMGILVMWMAAGFGMLEAGLVRSKNTATICLKIFLCSGLQVSFFICSVTT